MPAFFSRVFSRGKEKEKGKDGLKEPSSPTSKQYKRASRASAHSLLEGKFEAVSPSVSPTVEKCEEKEQIPKKDKEKEWTGLFRPKSRTTSGNDALRKQEEVPQLTLDLNLPVAKNDAKKRNLSIVYEGDTVLDDAVIGEKRLSSAEALKLMRACLAVLTSRGLETLGVMHPHWHSASPSAQRRIISLFLSSLAASSDTSSTSPTSAASTFDLELEYIRSPHDVAAVFRWALRHVKLEDDTFDKNNTPSLSWYDSFTGREKKADYPQTAYSDLLLPDVKPSHAELLDVTLNLVSRMASHSEANGTSGSKLSMLFGHYLLTGNRVEKLEDWLAFYSLWEQAGRALEHIFLASLRDEESRTGIPKRLSELIVNYPYAKDAVDDRFPRPPRFATRAYDALCIRVTSESASSRRSREEVHLPLQIVENALKSDVAGLSGDAKLAAIWEDIKKLSGLLEGTNVENASLEKTLAGVLSDESIRMLSLKSDVADKDAQTITMFTPVPEHVELFGRPMANGRGRAADGSKSVSRQTSEATTSSPIVTDWNAFSSAGFGESGPGQSLAATLLDSDIEKTEPPQVAPRRSLKKSRSPGRTSRAEAVELPASPTDVRFKTAAVSLVKIDESFIDFWSDALLDPISNAWPPFVVCRLKSDVVRTLDEKKVAWLVIEQKFVPPTPSEPLTPVRRAGSPRPSVRSEGESRPGIVSRVSATFSPRKRFNFFVSQSPPPSTVSSAEKRESRAIAKGAKVNELGELIPEEEDVPPSPVPKAEQSKAPEVKAKTNAKKRKDEAPRSVTSKADGLAAGAAAVVVGAGVLAVTADALADAVDAPANEAKPEPEVTSSLTKVDADEPAANLAVEQELAIEAHTDEPQATESAPEVAHEEGTQVAEPTVAPQVVAVRDEVTQAARPEVPAPEAPTADVGPSVLPTAEEASKVAESSEAEEPTVAIETEGAVAGAHHGAGESRFVEHMEISPSDEKAPELAVPETIQEASEEVTPAESDMPEEKLENLPTVPGTAAHEKGAEPPATGPKTVEEVDEPEHQVAGEGKEATSSVTEGVISSPEVELTTVADEETLATAVAEESAPIIDEDAGPILEEFTAPAAAESAPSEDHVDKHVAKAGAEVGVPAPASEEPIAKPSEESSDVGIIEPARPETLLDVPTSTGGENIREPTTTASEELESKPSTESINVDFVPRLEVETEESHSETPLDTFISGGERKGVELSPPISEEPKSESLAEPAQTDNAGPLEEKPDAPLPRVSSEDAPSGDKTEELHKEAPPSLSDVAS